MSSVQLNPSIIGSAVGQDVPLNDLGQVFNNAAQFRQHQQAISVSEEGQRQKQIMNDAYKAATRPDGTIDNNMLQAQLAGGGGGAQIPGVQKAQSELLKSNAETQNKITDTQKVGQEMLHKSLQLIDGSLASLVARSDVNDQMVFGEVGRLVNAGAFKVQAQHKGVSEDDYAKELLSTMPVGNPQALKPWLIQAGMRAADASERLRTMLPKFDEQDRGGVINNGTINMLTGQRTDGTNVQKTATPDAQLAAGTQRRGQDMVDKRAAANEVPADPAQRENIAKMISNGQMAPLSGPALRTADGLAIMSRVAELNPEFRGQNYNAVQKATSDFTTGKNGNTVRSFNVAISHLSTLSQLADALHNNDTQAVNKIGNFFSQQTGGAAVTNFDTAKKVVADEVVKAIVGSGGGVHDREEAAKVILASNSPAQLNGAIKNYTTLMHGQLDGLQHQYESTTGLKDFDKFLTPEALASRPRRPVAAPGGTVTPPAGTSPARRTGDRPSIDSFFK